MRAGKGIPFLDLITPHLELEEELMNAVIRHGGRYFNVEGADQLRAASLAIDSLEKGLVLQTEYIRNRPVYDSVVIAGGKGITAWTLAARLARSDEFAGRVVVAGPPVEESRLLRNGVSLRGAAADFIGYALQCSRAEFIRHIAGPQAAGQPVATRQTTAMARPSSEQA